MLAILARNWWVLALQGVIALVFGVLALIWPQLTLVTLVMLFGAYVLVNGVFALLSGISSMASRGDRGDGQRWWGAVIQGLVGILVGLFILLRPGTSTLLLVYLIAGWQLFSGMVEILAAIELRRVIRGEWLLILGGIASILFGVLLVAIPEAGLVGLAWLIGVYAVGLGVLFLAVGFRLRSLGRRGRTTTSRTGSAQPLAA